jgi:hypothetical protein
MVNPWRLIMLTACLWLIYYYFILDRKCLKDFFYSSSTLLHVVGGRGRRKSSKTRLNKLALLTIKNQKPAKAFIEP